MVTSTKDIEMNRRIESSARNPSFDGILLRTLSFFFLFFAQYDKMPQNVSKLYLYNLEKCNFS
jgi:hypothetical protein